MSDPRSIVDFTIEKPGEGVQLLVEVKNATAPSRDWITRFLRNLFMHGDIPASKFFLLALRDHFYLWHRPVTGTNPPDFETDTAAALGPYLQRVSASLDNLSESSFELLIQAWLSDLVAGTLPDSETRQWAEASGLADAVRDSSIRSGIAA